MSFKPFKLIISFRIISFETTTTAPEMLKGAYNTGPGMWTGSRLITQWEPVLIINPPQPLKVMLIL